MRVEEAYSEDEEERKEEGGDEEERGEKGGRIRHIQVERNKRVRRIAVARE